MSSMLVPTIIAARRRFYNSRKAEPESNSSTVRLISEQHELCDESQLDAAKKRLDERLQSQPTSHTKTSLMCLKLRKQGKEKSTRGKSKALKKS